MTSLAQIVESSCEVGLETDVVGDAFAVESVVSDVEGCAIAMTRILRGIGIASRETLDIAACSQHAGDDEAAVSAIVFLHELAESRKEVSGIGHEVRDGMGQRIDEVVARLLQFDES